MAEPSKFVRAVPKEAPKAEPAQEAAPKIARPHSVSRELGTLTVLVIGIGIGAVLMFVAMVGSVDMASDIVARGVAIGAAGR